MRLGKLLTLKEVADLLGCSDSTVYRLAQRGDLPGFKVSAKTWRFDAVLLDAWRLRAEWRRNGSD
jgi:excisionase family DNA binding protein